MTKSLYRLPISTKLAISFLIVIFVLAVVGSYVSARFTDENINKLSDSFVDITLKNSEEFLARKLLEDDKWAIYKFIKSISKNEFIRDGVVYNSENMVIAHSNPQSYPIATELSAEYIADGVSYDIFMGEKKLGVITLFKNQQTIDEKSFQSVKRLLAVFVLIAFASWLFAMFISKRILNRLREATKNAELIAKNRWKDVEFAKHAEQDEITILLNSMEKMSREIRAHIDSIEGLKVFYHSVLSNIDMLILIMDVDLHIVYENKHPIGEEFSHAFFVKNIESFKSVDNLSKVLEVKKNGKYFLVTSVFVDSSYLLSVSDITTLKDLEKRYSMSKSLAMLGEMSSFLSHELKNLLSPLKLLVDAKSINEQDVVVMKNSVKNMDSFVNNFLKFAKPPENGDEDISDLSMLLEEVLFLISSKLEKKRITLHKEYDSTTAKIHPKAFEIIALNLLLNAIDACEIGGNIWLSIKDGGDFLFFEIRDDGCGMSEEVLEKAFDPFFTTKGSGTGLGLSLVVRIVNDVDGEIEAYSKPKETKFIIKFRRSVSEYSSS